MKLEEILFNNVCQIPFYKPDATIRQIKNDVQAIERFTISGFLYRSRFEEKLAAVCKNMHQYDRLKLISSNIFASIDSKL